VLWLNLAAVVVSRAAANDSWAPRRYLYSSAVVMSLWTGLLLAACLRRGPWWLRAGSVALAVIFLSRAAYHQAILLRATDELAQMRWLICDMREQGYDRGVGHWGNAYVIDALTDEQTLVAATNEERIPDYTRLAADAGRLAGVERTDEPLLEEITFAGYVFRRDGPRRETQDLRWAPYRKVHE
jgi:hypothetical protein